MDVIFDLNQGSKINKYAYTINVCIISCAFSPFPMTPSFCLLIDL